MVPEESSARVILARLTPIVLANVLIAFVTLLGCERSDAPPSDALRPVIRAKLTIDNVRLGGQSKDPEVAEAVTIMSDCSVWTQHMDMKRQASERQKIIGCLRKLARYRTSVLRVAEMQYERNSRARSPYSSPSIGDLSVLFLLNRYVFDVPAVSPRSEARFFGGWEGVPVTENEVNLLWPLAVETSGSLDLTDTLFGGYNGPPFRAVEEFDYFDRRFGRRASK